jgi:predicted regulator of Ras-like GTPase activity (Roadblock/LC7/MglB family)
MSNSVKMKFAGLLRNLARRLGEEGATTPQTPRSLTVAAPRVTGTTPIAACPQMSPPAPPSTTAATPVVPRANPDELQLPLQSILAGLSLDLRAKMMQAPPAGAMIAVPLETILSQLAFGSVKIGFGELRKAAPGVFVNSGGEHDHKPVMLPLNEILSRLNPGLLSRHSAQKQVELAEDITGPFGAGGEGARISVATKPTPSTAIPPLRMPAPYSAPTPAPAPFSFAQRGTAPVNPAPASLVRQLAPQTPHIPMSPAASVPPRSNGMPKPAASIPVVPVSPPPAPVPPPRPPVSMPAAPQAPAGPAAISVPLAALVENWPEGLRLEIRQSNLASAQVLLPNNLIEPALKRGRIILAWGNLRPLISPIPPSPSVHDGIELELPLSVIAPLFFARPKTAPRAQVMEGPPVEIPNLFFGFPQPETPQPKPATARMPEPQPKPLAITPEPPISPIFKPVEAKPVEAKPVEPKSVNPKPSDTNYYIWSEAGETPQVDETEYKRSQRPATDFSSRYATPNEIVARAMELPGVMGAIVALPDGLKVASRIPPELNADTLAAFLPQIFDRVSQSTRELRMGALNNFNFTVGNVPWRIFRVNAVYFAAFGKAGESLPSAQLAALAAELDRKKQ